MEQSGIVYVATMNDSYVEEAFLSAESVKQRYPGLSITLFTDRPWHALCAARRFDDVRHVGPADDLGKPWRSGKLHRSICLAQTPYGRTLHLDTDTRVLTDQLPALFDELDQADIAMVETATDDSYSRRQFGRPMFNTGVICYRRNDRVLRLLSEWSVLSERNFRLAADDAAENIAFLGHIADGAVRKKLLNFDQVAMAELLSPEINSFDLKVKVLGGEWNHRGSRLPGNNRCPVKILHSPALRSLIHPDLLNVAFNWQQAGRLREAELLRLYVNAIYA